MSLKPFTYPFPETRFLHAGTNVYKFKIRYGNSIRGEEIEDKGVIIQELEDSIRAVLANMDSLQPFVTEHFIVFPCDTVDSNGSNETEDRLEDKSKWERVSHLKFKHGEIILTPYPFVFTLYIEMKCFAESLPSGKPTDDIPLELISEATSLQNVLLKWRCYKMPLVLAEKEAEEATMRKRKLMEEPSTPSRPGPHRAKMETWSEASSTKKALQDRKRPLEVKKRIEKVQEGYMKPWRTKCSTSKSWDEDSEQEHQDTPASDSTAVTEQDAMLGHSLPGLVVPPLEHSNPPPLKEPAARGFLGFLSALFPFRYFFRKSTQ